MTEGGLQISPSELKFKFELRKQVPTQLSLYNPTSDRIAFKIKTTQPKRYSVRPSAGFVEPHANIEVKITMQSQKEYPADINNCKDKFLVQTIPAKANETEVVAEMFSKDRPGLADNKLRVVFDLPSGPPVSIPEIGEQEYADMNLQQQSFKVPLEETNDQDVAATLRKKIDSLEKERNALREKISVLELSGGNRSGGAKSGGDKWAARSQVRLIHLLLVAVISFLIGHFL
eukprot:TRINITY_DN14496_c0_g1_i2.p3 TRINITY_DN14496_c0_g1~~TRINITY_DN14496_c0_g1_i2.p3  ORF type:complete len:265 (+),score=33.21 TRINITY_DN14496_c0_g1_i2:103-795(+)